MTPDIRVHRPAWVPPRALIPLAAIAACGHTDSFTSPPQGTDAPFDPAPPVRLTFNSLADRGAAWVPDGSGILYSAQQVGRADRDVCLARLPSTGGRQVSLTCDLSGYGPGFDQRHRVPLSFSRRSAGVCEVERENRSADRGQRRHCLG